MVSPVNIEPTDMSVPRNGLFGRCLQWHEGELFALAGDETIPVGNYGVHTSVDDGVNWTNPLAADAFSVRKYPFTASIDGTMFVAGGTFGATNRNDIRSSADGTSWAGAGTLPVGMDQRGQIATATFDGYLWLANGLKTAFTPSTRYANVWRTADMVTFAEMAATPGWSARTGSSLVVFKEKLWMIAGSEGSVTVPDVWFMNPDFTWTRATADAGFGTVNAFNGAAFVIGETLYYAIKSAIFATSNGYTWFSVTSTLDPASNPYGVATADDGTVFYGDFGEHYRLLTTAVGDMPAEGDLFEDPADVEGWRPCRPYGARRDVGTPTVGFGRSLIFDLKHGIVYPAWGLRVTATLHNGSPCAGPTQSPERIVGGGEDGYLYELLADDAAGLGIPARRVAWPIADGATTSVIPLAISVAVGFVQSGWLVGMDVIVEYSDGTTASGTILSNTNDTVTLSTALSVAPSEDDRLLISPMHCGVLFRERRTFSPASLDRLRLNVRDNQPDAQPFEFDVFQADLNEPTVDLASPAVTRQFTSDDMAHDVGGVGIQPNSSRANLYGLRFLPRGGGDLDIEGIEVTEVVAARDAVDEGRR